MDSYFLPMVCHVDQTQAAYLENVLGFIRVLEVVLAHIGKKLPEILDWLVYMDISESFDETTIDHSPLSDHCFNKRYAVTWLVLDPPLVFQIELGFFTWDW